MDREKDEDLTYLTFYNVSCISALNNIYYEIRWFCKEILDSKNRKRCSHVLTRIIWRDSFWVKIMVCDKNCEYIAKTWSLLILFYRKCLNLQTKLNRIARFL